MELYDLTKNLKILYVEDSATMRALTLEILSAYFNHIDIAKNGQEAIELYKKFHNEKENSYYDIVITDLEMPVMDGEKLSKKILKFNHTQEIIIMSGVEDFKKLIDLINVGVTKFISKPVEEEQLNSVISDVYNNIRTKQLQEEERLEVLEYNKILKQREDEHQKSLKAKAKQLEEFSHALDVSAIVSKTDPKGVMTYVNEHYCKISGYKEDELIGQNSNYLNSGNKPKSYFKKLWNTINDKKTYTMLFENKAKDGSLFYLETTISPILDVDSEIVEFIAVSHDMTLLIQSLDEANKSKKAKENFFINISHEMKTPLNAILGFSSLLKKRLVDDEKSLLMVNTIYETGTDLNKLIESIIDMRKIQEHSLVIIEILFNPHEELTKGINEYAKEAYAKKQKYEILMNSNIPNALIGDISRILQVIGILIDNAIKFTQKEGVIQIHIKYDNKKELLICQVKDNGIGIADEDQDKIFNMQQLDSTLNRSHEGAGLGLNIAKDLMKIMNGNIVVKSIPSKGSVFKLEFPLKEVVSDTGYSI